MQNLIFKKILLVFYSAGHFLTFLKILSDFLLPAQNLFERKKVSQYLKTAFLNPSLNGRYRRRVFGFTEVSAIFEKKLKDLSYYSFLPLPILIFIF